MPRVTTVTKAAKDQGHCGKCGDSIPAGAPYRWWKFRYGGKHRRCMKPACSPRGSDLTQARYGEALAALENLGDELAIWDGESLDELRDLFNAAADDVRSVAEDYRSAAEEMGAAGEQFEEWADYCDDAADILDNFYPDEFDPADVGEDDDVDAARHDWVADIQSEAQDVIQEADDAITQIG